MTSIAEQQGAILAQLRRQTGACTIHELAATFRARGDVGDLVRPDRLQRRLRELASAGKVAIYERAGPNRAHSYQEAKS